MARRKNAASDASAMTLDEDLGEVAFPGEAELAQAMASAAFVRERDGDGPYRRDVHPKAHGAVQATLLVP